MGILKWFGIGFATSTQNIFYFCQNRPSTKPLSKLCKYVCRDSLQKRLPIFLPKPLKYEKTSNRRYQLYTCRHIWLVKYSTRNYLGRLIFRKMLKLCVKYLKIPTDAEQTVF